MRETSGQHSQAASSKQQKQSTYGPVLVNGVLTWLSFFARCAYLAMKICLDISTIAGGCMASVMGRSLVLVPGGGRYGVMLGSVYTVG